MMLVLDASVVAKWFKDEEHSDIALKIREEFYKGVHDIIVPDLLFYEISNIMRHNDKFSLSLIMASIKSIFDLGINIAVPSEDLIINAVEIAYRHNITVYDAIYVALAMQTNGTFVTADRSLYKNIKNLKNSKFLPNFY